MLQNASLNSNATISLTLLARLSVPRNPAPYLSVCKSSTIVRRLVDQTSSRTSNASSQQARSQHTEFTVLLIVAMGTPNAQYASSPLGCFRYLRPVPGTVYYIYWDSEDEGWGAANIQRASSASATGGDAAAAAADGTIMPPQSVTKSSLTTTAAAAGHHGSGPVADNMTTALLHAYRGGSPHDNNSSSSSCAKESLQGRSSSLSAVANPATVAAASAAAAAAASSTSFPLFVRFEVVHDERVCADGPANAAAMAAVAAAAASGERNGNEQDGRGDDGGVDGIPGSFPYGVWHQRRRRHRSRGCVVDTSHTLSRALKLAPDVARAGLAVGKFDGAGACADGEGLGGAQSHLCIFATAFPASDWSRSASGGAEAGAGGGGHSPVKVKGELLLDICCFLRSLSALCINWSRSASSMLRRCECRTTAMILLLS